MVECTALEMRRAREGTQGSNPCLSAKQPRFPGAKPPYKTIVSKRARAATSVGSKSVLGSEIGARWTKLAKLAGRTKSFNVRAALTEKLAGLEDHFLAKARMVDIGSGKSETIKLDDIMAEYGLND